MDRALLNNLHQYPEFQFLLKELKTMRPIVPGFDVMNDNTELMKFKSAQQQQYDVLMQIINPYKDVP